MAVYQATGELTVSLPAGANCFPVDIIEMLEPFERIIIWMDDDQVGQDGAKKLANKLGKERCVLIQTRQGQKEGPKDANDALRAGVDLKEMLSSAKPIPHQQLLHFNELRDEVRRELANPDQVAGTKSLTFPTLTKILKGHRKGELTVFTGPTGIGKTSILSQLSMEFASQGIPTLWGSFEIQNHRLAKKMLLQMSKTNLEKDISQFSEHANKFEELPLYFLRFHGGTEIDQVLDAMEYAVYVHDVEHIILDNLQFMTPTHLMKGFDKFDLLDTCVSKLRKFATYRNVHVTIIIHPRKEDDGQLLTNASVFGSAKATQEADNVVIVQRGKAFRYLEVAKNRFSGDLGLVPYKFDPDTNSFTEMTEDEKKEAEKANAKSRAAAKKVASVGGAKKPHLAADGLPISAPWMLPEDGAPEVDGQEKAVGYDLS
jgi:twinkle protein